MHKAVIEMEQYSVLKNEVDKFTGTIAVDRLLKWPTPYAYGYVKNTLAQDGDPLDVFVVYDEGGLRPLMEVKLEVVGAFLCVDNGAVDEKLVAVIQGDTMKFETSALKDIRFYLEHYKEGFQVLEYVGKEQAEELIKKYHVDKS